MPSQAVKCSQCGSTLLYRDGLYYSSEGQIQRYLCRNCGRRFRKDNSNKQCLTSRQRHVCVKEAKNMTSGTVTKTVLGETQLQDINGKLVSYAFYMEKQGYKPETIRTNSGALRALQMRNADLLNPESVKEVLAREKKWSENRKRNVINAYSLLLKINGQSWEKPRCSIVRKIPFIPTEEEIDSLISGSSTRTATFLQLLKETAMRSGEAIQLQWIDIDLERRMLTLNKPEKGSLPRQWNNLTSKLLNMLDAMPRNDVRIFGPNTIYSIKNTFSRSRKRLALKLQNPRLLNIHFHTFRHWKAIMEYHKTKDLLHVMAFLGHKKSDNTLLYVQLDKNLYRNSDDHFIIKTAHNVEEAEELGEIGFEPFDIIDGMHLYRKRK